MFDTASLIFITFTFLLAGAVKGVIGLGLPTVSLAVLTATIGLQSAMALLLAPSFFTNLWQASVGGHARVLAPRIWPFLLFATITVGLGAMALTRIDVAILSGLLGVLITLYAVINLTGTHVVIARRSESWTGPIAGTVNGILTGMTGSFVFPGVLYLQAIGLPRDMFVQAMGMLFTLSTLALALALGGTRILTFELGAVSAVAVVPALIGMALGQALRKRIPEHKFRRVFFVALLILGIYISVQSLGG